MEHLTLETHPGKSVQASTPNLQSQSAWRRQVSPQTTTSVNQVLVCPTASSQASESGEHGQEDSRGGWHQKPETASTSSARTNPETLWQTQTITTDLDTQAWKKPAKTALNSDGFAIMPLIQLTFGI